jgi:hypothetical protein
MYPQHQTPTAAATVIPAAGRAEMALPVQAVPFPVAQPVAYPVPVQVAPLLPAPMVSSRAKDVAVVAAGAGTGIGAASAGIGYAAGVVAANASGLLTAAGAVALASGAVAALVTVLRGGRTEQEVSAQAEPAAPVYITHVQQTVTATGLLGRAIGGAVTTTNHTGA